MAIHPTAKVHPSAVIEGDVEIGARTVIEALCYLKGPLVIGEDTHLYPHCIVGTDAEHLRLESKGVVRIGNKTILRELTVVQRGTGDRETTIGDECFLMDHVHVPHDCVLGNSVTIAPNTVMAGHCRVHDFSTIGMGVVMHQFSTVGSGVMIGMGSVVAKDVPPFALAVGNPISFRRLNTHALTRLGKADKVTLEGGKVVSTDLEMQALLAKFEADRRQNRQLLEQEAQREAE